MLTLLMIVYIVGLFTASFISSLIVVPSKLQWTKTVAVITWPLWWVILLTLGTLILCVFILQVIFETVTGG